MSQEQIPRMMKGFLLFLLKEIFRKKKYWLLLVWCILAASGLVLFLTGNGALFPAIYMAF
jgi:hypothetical protein